MDKTFTFTFTYRELELLEQALLDGIEFNKRRLSSLDSEKFFCEHFHFIFEDSELISETKKKILEFQALNDKFFPVSASLRKECGRE